MTRHKVAAGGRGIGLVWNRYFYLHDVPSISTKSPGKLFTKKKPGGLQVRFY